MATAATTSGLLLSNRAKPKEKRTTEHETPRAGLGLREKRQFGSVAINPLLKNSSCVLPAPSDRSGAVGRVFGSRVEGRDA